MITEQPIPNPPALPTKEQYDIAKALVEAYEAKTGEKVVSATMTWDDMQNDYLKRNTKVFPIPEEHKELIDKTKSIFKGKC